MESETFLFNENGVCVNPNIYFSAGGYPKNYEIVAKTAMDLNGRWVFGLSYQHATGGGGHGCWNGDKDNYDTEKEAGVACLKLIRRFFEEQIAWYKRSPRPTDPDGTKITSHVASCFKAIEIIDEELKPKHIQLDLFNQ